MSKKKEGEGENELVEMQRRLKNLESDRKAYAEETQARLNKQKQLISKL